MVASRQRRRAEGTNLSVVEEERPDRYDDGWRAGKPVEDPEKLKRWGFITAKPSEYLVCVQRGRINRKVSGQGARVFKWPWESVAIIPTTLQRVEFVTDQVTRERVGVQVTGIAVYRIVEPEIAFRVLNFSFGERASEKLQATLREMFIGAARRLVANLSLDECLMKRKEAIAAFLMREIAPVVSGRGAAEDSTDRGWGVVLDTIEIQDVKVKSTQVFTDLQAGFRAELATRAATAELEREREVAERQAEVEAAKLERRQSLEQRRIEVEEALALRESEQRAAIERQRHQLERAEQLAGIQADEERRRTEAEAERRALAVEIELAEQAHLAQQRELEQTRQRQLFAHETARTERDAQVALDVELRHRLAQVLRTEKTVEAEHARAMAEVEQQVSQGRVQTEFVRSGLPAIAQALAQQVETLHYTHVGGGSGGPADLASNTLAQLLGVARSFGFDPAQWAPGAKRDERDSES